MFRARGFIGSLITLAIFGGGYAIFIKSGGAEKIANKASKAANNSGVDVPGASGSTEDPFKADVFGKAMGELKSKAGSNDELLEVSVYSNLKDETAPSAHVEITLRKKSNDSAYGYRWDSGKIEDVTVQVNGTGSLKDSVFSFSEIPDNATANIIKNLKAKVKKIDKLPESFLLKRTSIDGKLQWVGSYDANGRTSLTFFASPDGKKVTLNN